jgi:hypothetical protein
MLGHFTTYMCDRLEAKEAWHKELRSTDLFLKMQRRMDIERDFGFENQLSTFMGADIYEQLRPVNIRATAERVRAAVVLEQASGAGMDGATTFFAGVLNCARQNNRNSSSPSSSELLGMTYDPVTQELTGTTKFKTVLHPTRIFIAGKLFEYMINPGVFWPAWEKVPRDSQRALLTLAEDYARENGSSLQRMRHTGAVMITLFHLRQVTSFVCFSWDVA